MQYPSLAAMGCLRALCCALEVTFDDHGELVVCVPGDSVSGYAWVRFPLEAQDELTARGWLVLVGTDELEVSDQGVYWLRRWSESQRKRRAG